MRQGAAGQTQTRAGRSQLYGMWSPAQRTDLNLASYEVTFHPNPLTQSFDRFCTGGITAVNSNTDPTRIFSNKMFNRRKNNCAHRVK